MICSVIDRRHHHRGDESRDLPCLLISTTLAEGIVQRIKQNRIQIQRAWNLDIQPAQDRRMVSGVMNGDLINFSSKSATARAKTKRYWDSDPYDPYDRKLAYRLTPLLSLKAGQLAESATAGELQGVCHLACASDRLLHAAVVQSKILSVTPGLELVDRLWLGDAYTYEPKGRVHSFQIVERCACG